MEQQYDDRSMEVATRATRHTSESPSFQHLTFMKFVTRFTRVMSIVLFRTGLSFLFSTASAAGTSSTYKCHIHASYTILNDDHEHPLTPPTPSERVWAAEAVKSTYNSVHARFHTDYAMSSVQYVGLTVTPAAATAAAAEDVTARGPLRRRTGSVGTVYSSKHDIPFPNRRYSYHLTTTLSDTLGEIWDDNDSLEIIPTVDMEHVRLEGTVVHDQWVAAWCDELQQGRPRVFQDATACAIAFSGCTMKKEGDASFELEGNSTDVVHASDETTAVVGVIEQILTEGNLESVAQVSEKMV